MKIIHIVRRYGPVGGMERKGMSIRFRRKRLLPLLPSGEDWDEGST